MHPVVGGLIPLSAAGRYACPPLIVAGRQAVSFYLLYFLQVLQICHMVLNIVEKLPDDTRRGLFAVEATRCSPTRAER